MSTNENHLNRDSTYYFHDGSCIFQAENVLFKVHKSLLERDSAVFQTLFSLPPVSPDMAEDPVTTTSTIEGYSDDHPVIIQDPADDFRALCWVLYARPDDILSQQNEGTTDVARLIRLCIISHKYEFEHLFRWSWSIIQERYTQQQDLLISHCGGWEGVVRLLNLSYQCQGPKVTERLEGDWVNQIRNSSDSTESRTVFEAALDTAEKSPYLRSFHGRAYYAYLQAIGAFSGRSIKMNDFDQASLIDHTRTFSMFKKPRSTRLREGFWSLSQLRSRLSEAPELGTPSQTCYRHTGCPSQWRNWWMGTLVTMTPITLDPGALLSHMVSHTYSNYGSPSFPSGNCAGTIREALQGLQTKFNESLADHFMLPEN